MSPATEAGSRPGRRVTFLARTRNVTQRMRPDCLRPCASLRADLRLAIQAAVRQNSLRGTPLRSNTLPQIGGRSIGTLRCQCTQPERRAAGADTRVRTGADGLPDSWRNWPLALIQIAYAAIKNTKKLSRAWYRPLCPRACDGSLLGLAAAPQSAAASSSNLRQCV